MKPRAEDTYYWHSLSDKEKAGKKGRDFKAFFKAWTQHYGEAITSLVYR